MTKFLKIVLFACSALLIASCGNNQADVGSNKLSTSISEVTKSANFGKPASKEQIEQMKAKISGYFNGQYANNPKALMGAQTAANRASKANGTSKIAPQAAATVVAKPVFRFYNSNTGAHFYTMSEVERDYVKKTYPFFSYEGEQFYAYPDTDTALSPVFRFYNNVTGTHFYTINETEKDHVIATWPEIFSYEGIAWYARKAIGINMLPAYRFFNSRAGTHFYTADAAEKDHIIATWDFFKFEGMAYYAQVMPNYHYNNNPVPPAPDPVLNAATLAGVDVNNNGVRDDVERTIAANTLGQVLFNRNLEIAKNYSKLVTFQFTTRSDVKNNVFATHCLIVKKPIGMSIKDIAALIDDNAERQTELRKTAKLFPGGFINSEECI